MKEQLHTLLTEYHQVIHLPGNPICKTDVITHHIPVDLTASPIYIPSYRTSHAQRTVVDQAVQDMLSTGIIEPTTSPWNFPLLFLVPKRDGSHCPVVDYRRLNKITKLAKYPLPLLGDLLISMGHENKVFTTLNMSQGYWQVPLHEASEELTAFSTNAGHYQFTKMPFGISGAPLTFQRLINKVLQGLMGKSVFAFLDDIVVVSEDLSSHFCHLEAAFTRFRDAGLKLSKCHFLRKEIQYLGHKLGQTLVSTTQDKVEAILKYPTPTDLKSVRSFLGLCRYYRAFVCGYSTIAHPLTLLLRKDQPFTWGTEQQKAFEDLKAALTTPPVLTYPNFDKPFYLFTDASNIGLGAALMQYDARNMLRPLAYASRVLKPAETNYSPLYEH